MRRAAALGWMAPMSDAERMSAVEFNAEDRELIAVVRGVVEKRGAPVLANRRMLVGLLRDHAPERARAIRLLMTAYDGAAAARFLDRPTVEAKALENEARSLSSETGLREDLARWAVGIWAAALTPLAPEAPSDDRRPHAGEDRDESAAPTVAALATDPQPALVSAAADSVERPPPALPATVGGRLRGAVAAPTPATARKSKRTLLAVLGAGFALTALVAIRFALLRDSPLAMSRAPAVTHGGGAAIIAGVTENGASVVLASVSPDEADWPIMPDAGHPDGDARTWRFTTGLKYPDGRVFSYRPTVKMNARLDAGAANVRSADLAPARGAKSVSVSQSAPAVRSRDPSGADRLDMKFSDWRSDAASAPPICLNFTLDGDATRFEPHIFCATAISDGACTSQILGCGFFR